MSVPNRAPGVTWALRADFREWVQTGVDETVEIYMWDATLQEPRLLTIPRKNARLLARRLNQCIDGTRKA